LNGGGADLKFLYFPLKNMVISGLFLILQDSVGVWMDLDLHQLDYSLFVYLLKLLEISYMLKALMDQSGGVLSFWTL